MLMKTRTKVGSAVLAGVAAVLVAIGVDQSVRDTPEYRRAMETYRTGHPTCEWCGAPRVEVHHIRSIWLDPALACDTNNYISLCRRDHLALGHAGNFGRRCVTNIREICRMRVIVERGKEP
jgi:hypothetical protein